MEVYGYGARFFNRECVEFDCALTGDPNYPAVLGVNGILQVYAHALETVKICNMKLYLYKYIII